VDFRAIGRRGHGNLASVAASAAPLRRRQFTGPVTVLFWAHSSLATAWHIPLFITVAAPA